MNPAELCRLLAYTFYVALLAGCTAPVTATNEAQVVVERDSASFIVIGDWGNYGNSHQRAVAAQMNRLASSHPVDFIVSTGDNIYDKGVQDVDDPLFGKAFEDVYTLEHLVRLDWYLVLGNHDYQGNYRAQIDYSGVNPRWRLPATYHSLVLRFGGGHDAVLLFTDTNAFSRYYRNHPEKYLGVDQQDTDAQLRWAKQTLARRADADWRLVIGHHPVYSSGRHAGAQQDLHALVRLMERYDVRAYFAGHDHDLQHLKPPGSIDYFISGAGSKLRPTGTSEHTLFAESRRGFAYVTLQPTSMTVEFIGVDGTVLYRTTVAQGEPVPAPRAASWIGE